jgi:hypothetical protein
MTTKRHSLKTKSQKIIAKKTLLVESPGEVIHVMTPKIFTTGDNNSDNIKL